MAQYRMELASPADDHLLRQLLKATPMPGAISVAFQREPSYFAAGVVEGSLRQALVARHVPTQAVVGLGTRSIMTRYVNGQPTPVGYLSNLRVLPEHRRRSILARGYRFLEQLHADGQARLYLTTMADDNTAAKTLLTSGRAGLPRYVRMGRFHTAILAVQPPRRHGEPQPDPAVTIRPARHEDKPLILDFLCRLGPTRQFFPCYRDADMFVPGGLLHGLQPHDLLLAFRDQQLVGTLIFAAFQGLFTIEADCL